MARESLVLIDGHNLVYRAFFAMPALSNTRGEMTNAAFGFTSMLFKALNDHHPTYAIAAFDPPGGTFRHEEFAEYKAQRTAPPPELIPQFGWCREIVDALGIPVVEVPSFEADDVIGTLARKAEERGLDVMIVTGDLDVLQLVTDHVVVFASRRGISDTIVYDVDKVHERFGFEPPLVVDYKALQGDPSDNIPGVPGIGEKTAKSLVQEYGPLERILDAVPAMKEGRVRRALEGHMDQARQSKRTATIRVDMEIDLDLEPARLYHYDEETVRALFERFEFRSLLTRLPGRDGDGAAPPPAASNGASRSNGQALLTFDAPPRAAAETPLQNEVVVLRDAHATADAVERIREAGALDVRTVVEGNPRTGALLGVAFTAPSLGTSYYMPLRDGDSADDAAVQAVAGVLADPGIRKRGFDLKREVLAWKQRKVEVAGLSFDAMLAAYLTNTRLRVPALPVLGQDYLGLRVDVEESLLGSGRSKRALSDVPTDEAAAYFGAWVELLEPVGALLARHLDDMDARALHDDLELPLVPVLAAMELRGVAIDCDLLQAISAEMYQRITALEAEMHELAGYTFNPGSTQQLAR
ncbi:MAG: hypothetical protein JO198_05500, partial [Candidatus Dormibacteraeota bacterium]|nr:hypothetical protein [Candidatus Dormibacteraeota bacterium]